MNSNCSKLILIACALLSCSVFAADDPPCTVSDAQAAHGKPLVAEDAQAQKLREAYDAALKSWQLYHFQVARKEALGEITANEEQFLVQARSRMVQTSCELSALRADAVKQGWDVASLDLTLRQYQYPGFEAKVARHD